MEAARLVDVKGLRGPSGEFGAVGVVEVSGKCADVFRFVGERGAAGGAARRHVCG
jgi:hypothetical protein